jgi:uncharacterized protein
MTVDWTAFSPWTATAGGLLIGAAAGLYMLANGRIAGITGIVAGPLQALLQRRPLRAEAPHLLFVAGLLLAPWVWQLAAPLPATRSVAGSVTLLVAGLLVGVGTRMGGGCTSGHGVCGISRGSPRSLLNVAVFMGVGMATVAALRQLA